MADTIVKTVIKLIAITKDKKNGRSKPIMNIPFSYKSPFSKMFSEDWRRRNNLIYSINK